MITEMRKFSFLSFSFLFFFTFFPFLFFPIKLPRLLRSLRNWTTLSLVYMYVHIYIYIYIYICTYIHIYIHIHTCLLSRPFSNFICSKIGRHAVCCHAQIVIVGPTNCQYFASQIMVVQPYDDLIVVMPLTPAHCIGEALSAGLTHG